MNYLAEQRKGSKITPAQLTPVIFESKEIAAQWDYIQKEWNSDPILQFNPSELSLPRPEIFVEHAKKMVQLHQRFNLNYGPNSYARFYSLLSDNPGMGGVHRIMFIPAIELLGTDEQARKWLPDSYAHRIIGAYAQTELGHGSDVQSLETRAVYDANSKEFVISSAGIKGSKYWPGELGIFANHALVQAQLIIKDKSYGIHHFIVPIRDIETHQMLPGVKVGDIGPKIGYSTKDNGFMTLTNVRIPRNNMLMRYTQVAEDGTYKRSGNPKFAYVSMTHTRVGLIHDSVFVLPQALTIGIRYGAFRKQFKDEKGVERKVLDYHAHLDKLAPLLASAYAQVFGFYTVQKLYAETVEKAKANNFETLQDLHAVSSGMKAVYSWKTHFGIDQIRMSCGGQGFNDFSGLPSLWRHHAATPTVEGENTMIILQTSRFLLKNFKHAFENKGKSVSRFMSYLVDFKQILSSKSSVTSASDIRCPKNISDLLIFRVVYLVSQLAQFFVEKASQGVSQKEAWDLHAGAQLVELGIAFINQLTFESFRAGIAQIDDEENQNALQRLLTLFSLDSIIQQPVALIEGGYASGQVIQFARQERDALLREIRPDMIPLTDAFAFHDETLKSAIARSDGKMYETLYDWANNHNPLNKLEFHSKVFDEVKKIRNVVAPKL